MFLDIQLVIVCVFYTIVNTELSYGVRYTFSLLMPIYSNSFKLKCLGCLMLLLLELQLHCDCRSVACCFSLFAKILVFNWKFL